MHNFNPLPPWGGRHTLLFVSTFCTKISIHSLRGEGDDDWYDGWRQSQEISIHSLRGEGDGLNVYTNKKGVPHFNPLPPWGGRPYAAWIAEYNPLISIHSLRGEGDVGIA